MPAILSSLDANEEHSVGDSAIRGSISLMQALESSPHAAPSFRRHVAVQLAEQGIAVFLGPVGKVLDEVLNLLAGRFAESLDPAEIHGVRLH